MSATANLPQHTTNGSLPLVILFFGLFICIRSTAQIGGDWMWVTGSSTSNGLANYGPKGAASSAYTPGARDSHSGAGNAGGNFWMFGGEDASQSLYNDLWLYTVGTVQWTWVSGDNTPNHVGVYGTKGVAAAANKPGARMGQSITTDNTGNVWLFGGYGFDGAGNLGFLNDLWKFNPYSTQWTWIAGDNTANAQAKYLTLDVTAPQSKPGSRYYPSIASDASGNIWVFGGYGYDANGNQGAMNDLWAYSVTYNDWVWFFGSKTRNATGVYGTKGGSGTPGGRYQQSMVSDGSGHFWLFGGTDGSNHYFDDLWEYTPGGTFIWVGGDNTTNNGGIYGTKTVTATSNKPGSRSGTTLMSDGAGNFWLFGGYGFDVSTNPGQLNDLWQYATATGQWTWTGGDNTRSQSAQYGAIRMFATANKPSGRSTQPGFLDGSGNVYIMGGADPFSADNNDLWEFSPAYYTLASKAVTLQGAPENSGNVLTWQTQGEIDTRYFMVEKSADGASFADIGSVPAVGSGNNSYSFTDNHPLPGAAFYRLKTVDLDSSVAYSSIIVLTNAMAASSSLRVYPNPTASGITVSLPTDALLNTSVKLFSLDGRLISEQVITSRQQYFDLHEFAAGVYFLQLANGVSAKIVKD